VAKKITVLTGNPRKNCSTDLLVAAFIEGAEESGNEIFRFDTARLNISGCVDCKHCLKNDGVCQQDDDMQQVYQALRQSEVLVLASPVYWFAFSAQIKAAIDRMYSHIGKPYPIKECALLLAWDAAAADGAITIYKAMCNYLNWKNLGIVLEANVKEKSDWAVKDIFVRAHELGKSIH
jgi:multimeric flavodoxin WrbA